jgi:hypothetical protein
MGRKKLNRSKDFLKKRNRKLRMESYWRNVEKERANSLNRYYDNKEKI